LANIYMRRFILGWGGAFSSERATALNDRRADARRRVSDESIIEADVQKQRGVPGGKAIDCGNPEGDTRPVRDYLAALDNWN
jgi:hypothetical protein